MSTTLLFEDIDPSTSIINKDTISRYPTSGHENASVAYQKIAFRKGRYGQTQGNVLGDVNSSVPACPYHMPRNSLRFEEPRFKLEKKVSGDIIHARDINNLIDRIRAFQYIWEAESKNIYGFNIIASAPSTNVDISKLNYINPTDTIEPPFAINDPRISGTGTNIWVGNEEHFGCINGISEAEVRTKLDDQINTKFKTQIKFNDQVAYGFPENLDDVVTGAGGFWDDNIVINAGQEPLTATKFIQLLDPDGSVSENYKIMYIAGPKSGQIVKDKNGTDIVFKPYFKYVVSYRKDNQPDTNLSYYGFSMWYLKIYESNDQTKVVTTYENPSNVIAYKNKFKSPGNNNLDTTRINVTTIPEYTINLVNYATNIAQSELFWNDISGDVGTSVTLDKGTVLNFLNTNGITSIVIPEQKIDNGLYYYRKPGTSTWVKCKGIYSVKCFNFVKKTWTTYDATAKKTVSHEIYGVDVDCIGTDIFSSTSNLLEKHSNVLQPDGSYILDKTLFTDFITFVESNTGTLAPTKVTSGTVNYIPIYYGNVGQGFNYDEFGGLNTYQYDENGPTDNFQWEDYYYLEIGCPPGSTPENGLCRIDTTILYNSTNKLVSETQGGSTFWEDDITYTKGKKHTSVNPFPLVYASDYRNMRNVLKSYLDTILSVAQTGINDGRIDSVTSSEINQFYMNQSAQSSSFDKDNPDDSFMGYQAATSGIIKVNFYNTLVDAYKIMINSCICNADCACNIVCICNTNCGCNYSG